MENTTDNNHIPTLNNKSNAGFGAQFKNARTQKNISIKEVAGELNILERHLEAIENNDFDSLPQAAFTRGFVTSYAKFLKLDVNNVINHFESIYPKQSATSLTDIVKPNVDNQSLGKVSRSDAKKTNFGKLGGVLLVLGLLGFAVVYFTQSKKSANTATTDAAPTALESLEESNSIDTSDDSGTDNGDSTESTSESSANNSETSTDEAVTTTENSDDNTTENSSEENAGETEFVDYKVRPGDGLIALAKKHGITVQELAKANKMRVNQNLQLGQTIKVPNN